MYYILPFSMLVKPFLFLVTPVTDAKLKEDEKGIAMQQYVRDKQGEGHEDHLPQQRWKDSEGRMIEFQLIRLRTLAQEGVTRKLSSMFSTIRTNLFMGAEKARTFPGIHGRAETSNMPRTPRGR